MTDYQISEKIERLRQLTQVNAMSAWRYNNIDDVELPIVWEDWSIVRVNEKGHIIWEAGYKVLWLVQRLVIPESLQGYPLKGLSLRLALTWWAEDVRIYVNDRLVQSGDLLDYFTRVLLSSSVTPGEEITVALRLVSPGHDRGALMKSLYIYEFTSSDRLEPGFVADELAVLQKYWETFTPEKLEFLATAISLIDWSALTNAEEFEQTLSTLRQNLLSIPNSKLIPQNSLLQSDRIEPGFVADELAVLQKYWETFAPEKLDFLATTISLIDWSALTNAEEFEQTLSTLRQKLQGIQTSLLQSDRLSPGLVADELAVLQKYWETFTQEKLDFLATAISLIERSALTNAEEFEQTLSTLRQKLQGIQTSLLQSDRLSPGLVADELAVLQKYWETFTQEKLDFLATAISLIERSALTNAEEFEQTLSTLRQNLQGIPNSKLKTHSSKLFLLGHAHLDMAWLWPVSETWEAAQRTFASVLQLQEDFPDLIFCHSSPALYAWIEEHRPDLFAAIQKKVKAGSWEVVGGMWIEPDLNLISGESIARQLLYGQRYVLAKFRQLSKAAWVPDTFGFCWTLPQFLKLGGIEFFVTQKLEWNDTTKFPYGVFWWRSPDGTQILSLMSALIGEGIDPIKMATYSINWEVKTQLKDALWLPGVGDHGGGPTRDMLETAKRWENSPFFPKLEFTTACAYLQNLCGQLEQPETEENPQSPIPVWNDELYLEFHRGCYTTHADQKSWNRRCEGLLYRAELWASLSTLAVGTVYPKAELEDAWKKVLFNQFHDILPGTSINQVFVEANQAWQEVERVTEKILASSLSAIASQITLPPPPQPDALPIVVFNSLNWERSEVVAVPLPALDTSWQVYDQAGKPLLSQSLADRLLFVASDVPSVGYRVFWFCPQEAENLIPSTVTPGITHEGTDRGNDTISISEKLELFQKDSLDEKDRVLENEFLRVKVDWETGNLEGVFDKVNQREVLKEEGGNQIQAFKDSGQYWDAWNIDPNYAQHPLPASELKAIQWMERGEVQQRLRVIRKMGESEFCQDYVLLVRSPILKIVTTVNWQESHVLVKAAFPLNIMADYATYEIACGAIQRTTKPQEPREKAKWEVPALRWGDLSEDEYGISLLNDCKYGYDSQPNQLRLTLLRSPSWPDPEADKGYHEFTYALYPHKGDWRSAFTVRRGYELNLPLLAMLLPTVGEKRDSRLPPVGRFLDLSAENLILMAFKRSEDEPNQWVLRCYECHGESAELRLHSDLGLEIVRTVDLLERTVDAPETLADGKSFRISPWKLVSFQCSGESKMVKLP